VLTRGALEEAAARFLELLRTAADPNARAVGDWTIGDTAAHVREVTLLNRIWATGTAPPPTFRAVYDKACGASIDEVSDVNAMALAWESSRDPHVLARRIGDQVSSLVDGTAEAAGDEEVRWMGGIRLPVEAVLAHTLSELLVHGRDIARAERRSFPISSADVRLVFDGFLLAILASADPAQFAGERPAGAHGVSCELRLRGSEPVLLDVDDGRTSLLDPGSRRPDVRISADPAAMWLLMAGRISPVGPALRGQVVVSGRRPWRLRRLMRMMRMP
jgi:uncharacterized protein YdaU (DUF1376 family)